MTNGICEIKVAGVVHPLYFGRLAQEEISRRTDANILGNSVKVLTDMVYAGRVNYANRHELPFPSYTEISDLVEDWTDEEDYSEQVEAVDKCFRESKYGRKLVEGWEELKKKMESLVEEQEKILAASTSTGETSESTV